MNSRLGTQAPIWQHDGRQTPRLHLFCPRGRVDHWEVTGAHRQDCWLITGVDRRTEVSHSATVENARRVFRTGARSGTAEFAMGRDGCGFVPNPVASTRPKLVPGALRSPPTPEVPAGIPSILRFLRACDPVQVPPEPHKMEETVPLPRFRQSKQL